MRVFVIILTVLLPASMSALAGEKSSPQTQNMTNSVSRAEAFSGNISRQPQSAAAKHPGEFVLISLRGAITLQHSDTNLIVNVCIPDSPARNIPMDKICVWVLTEGGNSLVLKSRFPNGGLPSLELHNAGTSTAILTFFYLYDKKNPPQAIVLSVNGEYTVVKADDCPTFD